MMRIALLALLAACNRPSEEQCTKAVENVARLMNATGQYDLKSQVRRCRGGSTRDAVECAIAAKNRGDLLHCSFVTFDEQPGPGSGSAP